MVVSEDYHWKQEENTIASCCSLSPLLLVWGAALLEQDGRWRDSLSGWGSNCYTAPITWAFQSDERSGSQSGPKRWPFFGPILIHVAPPSVLNTQSSTLCQILPPLSGGPGLGLQALQLRSIDGKHTGGTRVDAQASSGRTGVGGWFPQRGQDGKIDVRGSRWFSLELKEEDWPSVYSWGRKPTLIISTLEALAVLVTLKLLFEETHPGEARESSDGPDEHGQCFSKQTDE